MNNLFAEDVLNGLSATPKSLPSKYFYDERGDKLFQEIMHMPEYYLTQCEYEVLAMKKDALLGRFLTGHNQFQLIELGAGDGLKTKVLLEHFLREGANFKYFPVDISENALTALTEDLQITFPELQVKSQQGEYFEAISKLKHDETSRNVVLFLGSNIGNFTEEKAVTFLSHLHASLTPGDLLLIGFDLKKDPSVILDAYNDQAGITRAFNLNLLQRINDELDANFDLGKFKHFPVYDPLSGETKSYLVSTEEQTITIDALGRSFHFSPWEAIQTEISKKYDLPAINELAARTNFEVMETHFDCKHFFMDAVWQVK